MSPFSAGADNTNVSDSTFTVKVGITGVEKIPVLQVGPENPVPSQSQVNVVAPLGEHVPLCLQVSG